MLQSTLRSLLVLIFYALSSPSTSAFIFTTREITTTMATTTTTKMSNNDDPDELTRKMFLSSISSTAIASTAFSSVAAAAATTTTTAGENTQSSIAAAPIMARMEQCDDVIVDDDVVLRHRRPRARVLSISLRSLPKSGCWSAPIQISRTLDSNNNEQYFTYLAVVDSGSPFLTAPTNAFRQTSTIMMTKKKKSSWSAAFRDDNNNNDDNENDNDNNQISYEQYGSTIGTVQWRMAPWVTLIGNGDKNVNVQYVMNYYGDNIDRSENVDIEPIIIEDQNNVILGIPSDIVQEESGGIFMGLMAVDENRPSFMKQFGYDAFSLRFQNGNNSEERYDKVENNEKNRDPASLVLWNGKQSDRSDAFNTNEMIDRFDPSSMKLFDLTPYGPDLHHYGVLCNNFVCRWDEKGEKNSVEAIEFDCCMGEDYENSGTPASSYHLSLSRLSRPLIAVFDTGLSGCIFSDSLLEEIQVERRRRRQNSDGPKDGDGNTMVNNDDNDNEPIGCTVWLPTIGSSRTTSTKKDLDVSSSQSPSDPCIVKLSSVTNYWRFQSFRLPWWYDNDDGVRRENDGPNNNDNNSRNNYPHVVVLGSAFWRNPNVQELSVDTKSNRAKIATIS
jgi:hypothetical protein